MAIQYEPLWTTWADYAATNRQYQGLDMPSQKFRPKGAGPVKQEVAKKPPMPLTTAVLTEQLNKILIGQEKSIQAILPYLITHSAGLTSGTRPVGSILLLGPSGVGKTATVEALAQVLHGDKTKLIRIDCGQFALQHEVAKLLGSPPGYLGHRETTPLINQKKLDSLTSENSNISIVLFDEIEKAHPSVFQMLLSVTDKAILTLGDNTNVSFINTILFFTSNLGAREMQQTIMPEMGFTPPVGTGSAKLERIGAVAVRKKFSPEFINRLDEQITYEPLSTTAISSIFTLAIDKVRETIFSKYGSNSFLLVFSEDATETLINMGFSERYGARELNRVIFRQVTKPLSNLLVEEKVAPGAVVRVSLSQDKEIVLDVLDSDTIKKLAKTK